MPKTKSEGKTVGILIGLRNSQTVRNLFARLRISQCTCEIGKAIANFANHIANLAMRNFAKDLKFYVRQMNSALALRNWHCEIGIAKLALRNWHCEIGIAKFARVANRLPTDCQNFCFAFFFKICSKICTKATKLMQEKLHKSKN